jgi:ABC-type spermidine/putrescine transport system permease subunit I
MTSGRRRRALGWVLAGPVLYLTVFYVAPMVVAATYSFWTVRDGRLTPGLTFENYGSVFTNPLTVTVFLRSVRVSLASAALALLLGYPAAYFLAKKVRRYQEALIILAVTPLWTSYLIRTLAWFPMLSRNGVVNSTLRALGLIEEPIEGLLFSAFAVTVALVAVYLPYMILPVYAVLEKLDDRLLEAAMDLGASRWQTFVNVILPLSRPGAAVGMLFVFVLSMGSFVTPAILGGTSGVMIGNQIANQFMITYDYPLGSAMALLLVAAILALSGLALRGGRVGELYR